MPVQRPVPATPFKPTVGTEVRILAGAHIGRRAKVMAMEGHRLHLKFSWSGDRAIVEAEQVRSTSRSAR